jgi:outer membrane immunogenic protein
MAKLPKIVALTTGILGLVGAAAPASADGYAGRGYAAPYFSWNGYYVGINGGYGFSGDDSSAAWTETFATAPFFGPANGGSLDIAGGFGGLQIGANHQFGRIVVGLEADAQGGNISDTASASVTPYLAPGGVAAISSKNSVNWFGTVRPRLGYAFDRTLIYATGGLAWGEVKHTLSWADNFGFRAFDGSDQLRFGYVLGGGIEHAFSSRLSVKVEYQYIDLGSLNYNAPEVFCGAGGLSACAATAFVIHQKADTEFHTVRLGLNYKFNDRRELEPLK